MIELDALPEEPKRKFSPGVSGRPMTYEEAQDMYREITRERPTTMEEAAEIAEAGRGGTLRTATVAWPHHYDNATTTNATTTNATTEGYVGYVPETVQYAAPEPIPPRAKMPLVEDTTTSPRFLPNGKIAMPGLLKGLGEWIAGRFVTDPKEKAELKQVLHIYDEPVLTATTTTTTTATVEDIPMYAVDPGPPPGTE